MYNNYGKDYNFKLLFKNTSATVKRNLQVLPRIQMLFLLLSPHYLSQQYCCLTSRSSLIFLVCQSPALTKLATFPCTIFERLVFRSCVSHCIVIRLSFISFLHCKFFWSSLARFALSHTFPQQGPQNMESHKIACILSSFLTSGPPCKIQPQSP